MRTLFITFFLLVTLQTHAAVEDFSSSITVASNIKLTMKLRWGALIKAAKYANLEQLVQISKFSASKEWYMRNAALVALNQVSHAVAMIEAKKLIYDKSLVVRSAAVEIISSNLSDENKAILAIEMRKAYNFNKKSSLWIRKQIVEKISNAASLADRDFFVRGLFDTDKDIARLSATTLTKITGEQVGSAELVEKWQQRVKQNNWL